MVRWLGIIGFLAGCLQAELVPCGELSCPNGSLCVDGRCASNDQVEACFEQVEGADCIVVGAVGVCLSGVCTPSGCGNRVVDRGEICDDGNTADGDGCSSDCASLEVCGNGIVDVAEGCDCGADASTKPAACRFTNSNDLDAECSATCEQRYCGDGTINDLEQCDGSQLGQASCTDFGYYTGALACSTLCRFAPEDSCSGRCGDGVVDAAQGEFCDGMAPAGTCLTYGLDAGSVGCSASCSPDVTGCEQFGWRQIDVTPARDTWALLDQVVVIASDASGAFVLINGVRTDAPAGTYRVAAGTATVGDAIGDTAIATWNGTAWSTMAVGWTAGTPVAAWRHATLGLYVALTTGDVWRYDGAWSVQGLSGIIGLTGSSTALYAWGAASLEVTTGAAWTPISTPGSGPIAVVGAADSQLWLIRNNQLYRSPPSPIGWSVPFFHAATRGRTTPSGDFVTNFGGVTRAFIASTGETSLVSVPAPGGAVQGLATASDGSLVVANTNGTHRMRTGAWDQNQPDAGWVEYQEFSFQRFTVSPTGQRIAAGTMGPWGGGPTGSYFPYASANPALGFNVNDGAFDRLGVAHFATNDGIFSDATGAIIPETEFTPFTTMDAARDGELIAGADGLLARDAGAGWHLIALPGCSVEALARGASPTVYAICTGAASDSVIAIDEAAATITTLPALGVDLVALWVADGGEVVAISASRMFVNSGGAWTMHDLPAGLAARSVSGTSVSDVFIGGVAQPFSVSTGLVRWDGAAFTPIRLRDGGENPLDVYVSDRMISYVSGRRFVYDLMRLAW